MIANLIVNVDCNFLCKFLASFVNLYILWKQFKKGKNLSAFNTIFVICILNVVLTLVVAVVCSFSTTTTAFFLLLFLINCQFYCLAIRKFVLFMNLNLSSFSNCQLKQIRARHFVKCDIFHCYMQINLGFSLLENSNKFVRQFLGLIYAIYLHNVMDLLAIYHTNELNKGEKYLFFFVWWIKIIGRHGLTFACSFKIIYLPLDFSSSRAIDD